MATITPEWSTNPDSTSEFILEGGSTHTATRNGGYDGGVFIDTVNGTTGTLIGVNGTSTNPSRNPTDAFAIAADSHVNTTNFIIAAGSAVTLPSDSSGKKFTGSSYTIALNGQNIGNSLFDGASISGIGIDTSGGRAPSFLLCGIGTVTLPPCNGFQCGFFGTFTIGTAGNYTFGGSADVFNLGLTLDYGAALNSSQFFLQSWGGGMVEIQNAGAGTGSYLFEMNGTGDLTVNANCSATTTVRLRGHIERNAKVAGLIYDERNIDVAADTMLQGTVDTVLNGHVPTNTTFQSDDITESTTGPFIDRVVIFTSGNLIRQQAVISNYQRIGSAGQFTVEQMTEAPANDDTFIVV